MKHYHSTLAHSIISYLKKTLLIFAISLSLSVMVSCVLMTTTFYRPEAMTGNVVIQHCPPTESFILFETNGVIYGARASESSDNHIIMNITFEIPKGKTVKLVDHKVYSLIDNKIYASSNLIGRKWISAGRTKEFPITTPMLGKTEKKLFFKQITPYGTTNYAYYFFSAQLSVPEMKHILIKLPIFTINGVRVEPPKIIFSQESKQYIGSLNC